MNSNNYDFEDEGFEDARQQLEAYAMHCLEIQRKARALLSHPGALYFAHLIADGIADTVREHASLEDKGYATLVDILAGTVAEHVITQALDNHEGVLQQPLNRDGFFSIRAGLDAVCMTLELLLPAEVAQ